MCTKKFYIVFVLLLIFSFSTTAFASLTFTANAITGSTDGTIDLGSGHNLFLQTSGGRVGIGTASPTHTLSVSGNADISGTLTVGSCTGCGGGSTWGSITG